MEEYSGFRLHIKCPYPVSVFSLVIGGWYPTILASGYVLAIDRNILSLLQSESEPKNGRDSTIDLWWFEYLNRPDVTINPAMCAIEGRCRRPPSRDEIEEEMKIASKKLNDYLPAAKIIPQSQAMYDALHEICKEMASSYKREVEFLLEVAPLICERKGLSKARVIEEKILQVAKGKGIAKSSLIPVAVMSCLYEDNRGEIPLVCRKIIKPRYGYDAADAHNCISDLRALKLLVMGSFMGNLAFCTRDKNLAAFWCMLSPKVSYKDERRTDVTLALRAELFPRLDHDEVSRLRERLTGA